MESQEATPLWSPHRQTSFEALGSHHLGSPGQAPGHIPLRMAPDLLCGFWKVSSPLWASPLKLYQIKMSIIKADLWLCQHMIGNTVTKFTHVETGLSDDICLRWPSLQVTELGLDLRSDRFQGPWPLSFSPQGHTQLGKIGKASV